MRVVGVAEAKAALAERLQTGGEMYEENWNEALYLAKESAERGCKSGQNTYGNMFHRIGKYREAFEWYRAACMGDPASGGNPCPAAIGNLACAFLNGHGTMRSLRRALGCFEKAVEQRLVQFKETVEQVKQLLKANGEDPASDLERLMLISPPSVRSYLHVMQQLGADGPPNPQKLKPRDPSLLKGARTEYSKALLNAFDMFIRGQEMVASGETKEAGIRLMAQALEVDETVCFPDLDLQAAIDECVDTMLKRDPRDRHALIMRSYKHAPDVHRFIEWLRHCVVLYPTDVYFVSLLGVALGHHVSQLEEGARMLERAVSLCPNDLDLYFLVGKAYKNLNAVSKAEAAYQKFLDRAPLDHRNRPHATYDLIWLRARNRLDSLDEVKRKFKLALEDEKDQLPYYLPIEGVSNN